MVSRVEGEHRLPLLPASMSRFFVRRMHETVGAGLMALGVLLTLSLSSYEARDASFSVATAAPTSNLLGRPGAYIADLVLHAIGLAAALAVLMVLAWGWAFLSHRGLSRWPLRLGLAPVVILLGAIGFHRLGHYEFWPLEIGLGGALGDLVGGPLERLIDSFRAPGFVLPIAAFAVALVALVISLGLTLREWRALYRVSRVALHLAVFQPLGFGLRLVRRRLNMPVAAPRREPAANLFDYAARPDPVAPEEDADEIDEPPLAPRRTGRVSERVEAPVKKPKSSRRAAADRQATLELASGKEYELPSLSLLVEAPAPKRSAALDEAAIEQNARLLESVLQDFGVNGKIIKVRPGPVVTLYELAPEPGTRTSRVIGLADDIARSMSAVSVRVATVPGRNVIGIELPNPQRETVYLRELLSSEAYESTAVSLTLALGKDIAGNPVIADLARMPHLLVAGTTGSGKSVAINSMILSLLYRLPPDQCKMIMIDPKMLELSVYDDIPHLIAPVVTEPGKAVVALKWAVREMETRYQAMSRLGVRNIAGYNKRLEEARKSGEKLTRRVQTGIDAETGEPSFVEQELGHDPLPYIVIVVDEMADLMLVAGKDIETAVQRLAQMARAAGLHLIMATQRPSVDVITGTIKANFPTRISFQVTSKIDSRTVLGEQGAEQLLGQGDMLYMEGGGRIMRVHGPYVSDAEVERVTEALRAKGRPAYIEEVLEEPESAGGSGAEAFGEDPLYDQALALVARERKASTSFIQRHLQIGYNRAARIIERMEAENVVTRANHVGKREVLVGDHSSRAQ
ncbi:MAG: DNA translocase FtsK [Alphaproteobacteria bacterium]|nr:DNA translocase FtsK [Alphaproteobacteria bacterium]